VKALEPAITVLPRHTLFALDHCAAILGLLHHEARLLVEDGSLRLAFDLAIQPGRSRRMIVVTCESLVDYNLDPKLRRTETPASVQAEVAALFPAIEDKIAASRLQDIFRCSPQHLARLAKAGHLKVVRAGKKGGGNSALITRASCIEFLLARRITE
jgi:hypothetical protein